MLSQKPAQRIAADAVAEHCFFWSADKTLQFLNDVSDRLEREPIDSPIVRELESCSERVVGGRWDARITKRLLSDAGRHRTYDVTRYQAHKRTEQTCLHHFQSLQRLTCCFTVLLIAFA